MDFFIGLVTAGRASISYVLLTWNVSVSNKFHYRLMLNIMIVWVMKDYGVKESWTPELRIIIHGLFWSLSFPQVLNLTEEGEVWEA
ncbi:hypothetical protein Pyn_10570 [Prunus yedoensis var. nudiflora]|uniref:Uncharacterized protein n=1 Tax=Prunus yedoensis var. nudiflora TaxID=2094558 RepID=A0A314XRT9_PRUYE|nr:hypothetical protein Pyn_10570 [Prunus yedoensis var. nudiflora]